jgi:hypothetical protein
MEKEQNVELLLAPTTFKELLRVYMWDVVEDASILHHRELKTYSAHMDIKIQNVLLRMRAYNLTKDEVKTAKQIGWRKM